MIERLQKEFKGKGDTKNYWYTQVYARKCKDGKYAYIYEQRDISVDENYTAGYEVVKPKLTNKVKVDRVDDRTTFTKLDDLCETYPNSNQWGINGFTFKTLNDAMRKIAAL